MSIRDIQYQLAALTQENERGTDALYEAEVRLAQAEHELDLVEQKAYIRAQGTVRDREALAKLESADLRLQRDLRKAEMNRIKMKIKSIEVSIMALATQAKLVQSEMKL